MGYAKPISNAELLKKVTALESKVNDLEKKSKNKKQATYGLVHMNRVLGETKAGLEVQEKVRAAAEAIQKELRGEQEAIIKLQKSLQDSFLAAKAKEKKQAELAEKMNSFQKLQYTKQMEMQRKQAELMGPVSQKVMGIVKEIAQRLDLEVVINPADSRHLVYIKEPVEDLTNEVIVDLNKSTEKKAKS